MLFNQLELKIDLFLRHQMFPHDLVLFLHLAIPFIKEFFVALWFELFTHQQNCLLAVANFLLVFSPKNPLGNFLEACIYNSLNSIILRTAVTVHIGYISLDEPGSLIFNFHRHQLNFWALALLRSRSLWVSLWLLLISEKVIHFLKGQVRELWDDS
jgi:hypothetical protein